MEDNPTAVSYFISIFAVIGGALLIPSLPICIMIIGPLLLLSVLAYALLKRKRRSSYSQAPVAVSQSRTVSGICETAL